MIDSLQGHYLSLNGFSFHAVIQLCFLIYFYCVLSHWCFMVAYVYYCVGALANWFSNLIVLKFTLTWRTICIALDLRRAMWSMLQSCGSLFADVSLNAQRYESVFATAHAGVCTGSSEAVRGGCRWSFAISSESIIRLWVFLFIILILIEPPCYLRAWALRCRGLGPTSLVRGAVSWRALRKATGQLTSVGCYSRDIPTTAFVTVWVVRGLAGLLSGVSCASSPLSCSCDALNCLLGFTSITMEHVLKLSGVISWVGIVGGDWDGLAAVVRSLLLFNIGIIFLRNRGFYFFYLVRMRNNLPCWSTCCSAHHPAIFLAWHSMAWYWIFIIVCLNHFGISFNPSWIVDMSFISCFWY